MANVALKDKDYDIISVVYHASQACETSQKYAADAESEDDKDAAAYFHRVREQNAVLVEQGKQLLKRRL